ncbi:Calcineurin-like phosphoesterase [Variovorax sp. OK605]|uniref:metallophosphoesterase n=1 Tax=Variovorax sp. OK605 TaxID=1855317 RepID=UPI0008F35438|nr:metallophosphoesterase [Variovorax sp. OK605]SFQ44018.1 Calcineurin-like phosphoesterase [Variovorax sp. OK605]
MADAPTAGVCDCSEPAPKLALILYPSLGTPLLLGPDQTRCSVFIAAASLGAANGQAARKTADGRSSVVPLDKDASAVVARHLRLVGMKGPKPDADIDLGELTGDGKDCGIARTAIKVWQVARFEAGALVYNQKGEVFATLAPQAVRAYAAAGFAGGHVYEVELDIARLAVKPDTGVFKSFAWMVRPTKAQKQDFPSLCQTATVHAQDLLVEAFLAQQVQTDSHRHQATNAPAVSRRGKEAALLEYDVGRTGKSAESLYIETGARLAAWHPVIRLPSHAPLKLGHLSDVHISVRHRALAKSPAHVIEDPQFTGDARPAVGTLVCDAFNALKALFDEIGAGRKPDTALLLTGDLIDFNRNVDPRKVPDAHIGEQWKRFNVLNKLNNPREPDLYPRGQDDMLAFSLVRYAYNELKLPVFMTTGNHEAYDVAYGVYPRVGLWGAALGAMEILRATMRRTETCWLDFIKASDALDARIEEIGDAAMAAAHGAGGAAAKALETSRQQTQAALARLQADSNAAADKAHSALDEYLRQVKAGQPRVTAQAVQIPSGTGLATHAWRLYQRALGSARQTVADATNAAVGELWDAYTGIVGAVGHGTIGVDRAVASVGLKLAGAADDLGTLAADLGVRAGVVGAQSAVRAQAASAHLAVKTARTDARAALQANGALLAGLDKRLAIHRQDVDAASKFWGAQANPGIPADHNLTVLEATLAYGPTYGETWTSLNFTTANFDWFGVLFTPLADFCIALPSQGDVVSPPRQVLVGLAWGETENFMNLEGAVPAGTDRHSYMILPRASASIDAAQQAVLRQALALKGQSQAPLVVASHFTMVNYSKAALQEELSFVPDNAPRGTLSADGFSPAAVSGSAGFNDANFGTCERNLRWYFENCAGVPGKPARVDWHLSGHSHRSALYTVRHGRNAAGAPTVTVTGRRDPGMYQGKSVAAADSGTQFVVSSCGGPIGVQNLAGELNGHTLRPPAGSRLDCAGRSIEQVKTLRTGRASGTPYNEKPRLCVALDYLYILQRGKSPVVFEWESRAGAGARRRPATVRMRLSEQVQKLDCIAAVKVWVCELKKSKAGGTGQAEPAWHRLAPTLIRGKDGSVLVFSAAELATLESAMVTAAKRPAVGAAANPARGTAPVVTRRVAQAFCEIVLKKPTTGRYTEGPEKGKDVPDWSADMKWENDPWVFPLDIGSSQTGAGTHDFMQRRDGEHGQVPDWDFLATHYQSKGYIPKDRAIRRDASK